MDCLKNNLMYLINKHCEDKSYTKIAKEIGISKQLFHNYLRGKYKTISEDKLNLIMNWAHKYDSTLTAQWLIGDSEQAHDMPINGLDLSQQSVENIKLLTNQRLSPLLNYIFEQKSFIDILVEIQHQQEIIKKQAKLGKSIDLEFAEFKTQKAIHKLVDCISQEYAKIHSTYYVKDLLSNQIKDNKDEN